MEQTNNILEYVGLSRQQQFMKIGGQLDRYEFTNKKLYLELIKEELSELVEAYESFDDLYIPLKINKDILDAYADILVVILGYYSIGKIPEQYEISHEKIKNQIANFKLSKIDIELELLSNLFSITEVLKDKNQTNLANEKLIPTIFFTVLLLLDIYSLSVKEVMDEVFKSNMSKFEIDDSGEYYAILGEDGRILKGKNFVLPNFEQFLVKETNG